MKGLLGYAAWVLGLLALHGAGLEEGLGILVVTVIAQGRKEGAEI